MKNITDYTYLGVTIFFGFGMDMVPQVQRDFANIVLGVAVGVQVFWDIFFDAERLLRRRKAKGTHTTCLKPIFSSVS